MLRVCVRSCLAIRRKEACVPHQPFCVQLHPAYQQRLPTTAAAGLGPAVCGVSCCSAPQTPSSQELCTRPRVFAAVFYTYVSRQCMRTFVPQRTLVSRAFVGQCRGHNICKQKHQGGEMQGPCLPLPSVILSPCHSLMRVFQLPALCVSSTVRLLCQAVPAGWWMLP